MKRKENKKFGLEKFEVAKLTSLRNTYGGTENNNNNGTGDGNITDMIKKILSSDDCK